MTGPAIVQLSNGVTYTGDGTAKTISPDDVVSSYAAALMDTGDLIGPQIDEFSGIRGTWDDYPASMLAAFFDAAIVNNLEVTWFADDGTPPPPAAT